MKLNDLFLQAVKQKASDIHLITDLPPTLRINGRLSYVGKDKLTEKEIETLIRGILDERQMEIYLRDKELDVSYEVEGFARFRVNLHWERGAMSLAARIISDTIPTFEDLLMPEVVYDLTRQAQGLIIVTGPTGSGKSTTLASMINLINEERRSSIITLEDPVEFIFKPKNSIIRQRQLNTDMLSFDQGLKHILRQDPDVVMVGEMRDLETIAATITLAETGHLVLATLHTFSAAQTVDRIIDIFPPHQQNQVRLQLSMTLTGIISQRLLPSVDETLLASREILINTPAVANLIRESKVAQIKTAIQTGAEDGMITMDQDLKNLYKKNKITRKVAEAALMNAEVLG